MNSNEQFDAIVRSYYEPLFRFALSRTRSESDARDLTQQVFSIWATKGHQLRDLSKVKTWLFTTLHRQFLMTKRRERRFPQDELDEVSDQLPLHVPEFANYVDSAQVMIALAQVDGVYQTAVVLFYLEDRSYREIAQRLNVPLGTVKSRIARGILRLRELLLGDDLPRDFVCPERDSSTTLVSGTHQGFLNPNCVPATFGSGVNRKSN